MISTAALLAALAFWAPYNHGPLPCTVANVHMYSDIQKDYPKYATVASGAMGFGPQEVDVFGHRIPTCDIYLQKDLRYARLSKQCAVPLHEWGHTWMMLDHSTDSKNVMSEEIPIPPVCQALDKKKRR